MEPEKEENPTNNWFTDEDVRKLRGYQNQLEVLDKKIKRTMLKNGVFTENFILTTLGKLSYIDYEIEKIEIIFLHKDLSVKEELKEKELKDFIKKLRLKEILIRENIYRAISLKMIKYPKFLPFTSKKEEKVLKEEKKEKDISDYFNLDSFKRKEK